MTHSVAQTAKVVTPVTTEEASSALAAANASATPVNFTGGGTKQEAGNLAQPCGLKISTTNLNELINYFPEDLTITVGAGMEFARLQEILAGHGQWLSFDPPNLPGQTLGGLMAANPSGPKRLLYGTARDLLIGCEFVLADGSIGRSGGRVVKNVTGYDLHKLMIGSLGTLGLLTEVTFKVLPLPQHTEWAAALFEKAEDALTAARQAARSNTSPAALEVLNLPAQQQLSEQSGLALPEAPYILFFAAEGVEVAVKDQIKALTALCQKAGASEVIPTEGLEENKALWYGLRDLPVSPAYNLRLKWSSQLTELPAAFKSAEHLAAELALIDAAFQVRAGTGVVYFYASLEEGQLEQAAGLIEKARSAVSRQSGSLVIEAAPVALKEKLDVFGSVGDAFEAMKDLKQKLDPQAILNPGRFLKGI
jgi:glycolate oxidase FAD binding subunit